MSDFIISCDVDLAVRQDWRDGMNGAQIAHKHLLALTTIRNILEAGGYRLGRLWVGGVIQSKIPAVIEEPAPRFKAKSKWPEPKKPARVSSHPIMATQGKAAALEAYAAANGISRTKALQLWHQARAGVV